MVMVLIFFQNIIVGLFILIYFARDLILSLKNRKSPLYFITYIFWFVLASFFLFISYVSWDNYNNPDESTDYYVVETKITRIDYDEDGGCYLYFKDVKGSIAASSEQYRSVNVKPHVYVAVNKETGLGWDNCFWSADDQKYVGDKLKK